MAHKVRRRGAFVKGSRYISIIICISAWPVNMLSYLATGFLDQSILEIYRPQINLHMHCMACICASNGQVLYLAFSSLKHEYHT